MKALLVATLLVLAGCSSTPSGTTAQGDASGSVWVQEVPTKRGSVTCVIWDSHSYKGGISCDWDNVR